MVNFSQLLEELKTAQQLSEKELSELTGISQPTLNRILNGTTNSLRGKTLRTLASFFDISLQEKKPSYLENARKHSTIMVPVFGWDNLRDQIKALDRMTTISPNFQYIEVMAKTEGEVFALIVQDSLLEPRFPLGTNLIIRPNAPFKNRDYVLIDSGQDISIKQLLVDGNIQYLKSLSSELNFPIFKLNNSDKIIGVLVQAIVNYAEVI